MTGSTPAPAPAPALHADAPGLVQVRGGRIVWTDESASSLLRVSHGPFAAWAPDAPLEGQPWPFALPDGVSVTGWQAWPVDAATQDQPRLYWTAQAWPPGTVDGHLLQLTAAPARSNPVRELPGLPAAMDDFQPFLEAMDQSVDALAILDAQTGRFLYVNDRYAEISGMSREQLLQLTPWQARGGQREETLADFARLVREYPSVQVFEAEYVWGGKRIVGRTARRAARAGDGWVILSSGTDITHERNLQRQLAERVQELDRSNKDLEQFAYIVSHDLSEPLRMVAAYTELLRRRHGDALQGDAAEFMGFIVDGAHRMQRMLADLLKYSRAGRQPASPEPVPLEAVLDDVLLDLSPRVAETGAHIERGPLPVVLGQRTGLTQVLLNLIANALKFHGPGVTPQVSVGAQVAEGMARIQVSDNGIGIDPRHFERIFVVFQRLNPQSAYEGTGIGLAVCKKIVERLGGRIEVESPVADGRGARFTVTLRLAP